MTERHEDALRRALREGASGGAGGGSFDDVRSRARRLDRRARTAKVAGAFVAVLAIAGIAVPQLVDDEPRPQDVVTEPGPEEPAVEERMGIWTGTADPVATASSFLRELGMDAVVLSDDNGRYDGEITLFTEGRHRNTAVVLDRLGESENWTVVRVGSAGLDLDAPEHGAVVTSPVAVSGRATAFEGTVQVRVVDDELDELGAGVLTGAMGEWQPFAGSVDFAPGDATVGAIVAVTHSAENGSVEQVAALPVRFAEDREQIEPLADDELVAVLNRPKDGDLGEQDVVVLSTEDGSIKRTLLEGFSVHEGGVLDVHVMPDRRTVLLALSMSACESLVRGVAADGSVLEPDELGTGDLVAVSPDGTRTAVVTDRECDGTDAIEIITQSAVHEIDGRVVALTWADDETLVYEVEGEGVFARTFDGQADRLLGEHYSLPLATGAESVLRVVVDDDYLGDIDARTGDGLGFATDVPPDVVDHALVGAEPYWVTSDGVLHGFERVVRRDVALIAS